MLKGKKFNAFALYIFKRWAERPAICYEPERKVQADSDRSDIRVFETGLSTQRYGVTGKARELQRKRNAIG